MADDTTFTLRPMVHADGQALVALGEQTPETGMVSIHSRFERDAYDTLLALRPGTIGVVAETADHPGLVGLCSKTFAQCWFEGAIRPSAYLYSLSVHPGYRRRGLASRLTAWLVGTARERYGNDVVIYAGTQPGNVASQRTMQSWASQRFDRVVAVVKKPRGKSPPPPSGLVVRTAEEHDLEEIATRRNTFHDEYNLYSPESAASISAWRAHAPFGFQFREYHVVVDPRGTLLAGAGFVEEGLLLSAQVVSVATPLRLANVVLRIVPRDGVMKRVVVDGLWFADDRQDAAAFLWEWMRWLAHDRASIAMVFFDARSPLAGIIRMPRWIPSPPGTLVVAGPVPMQEDRLIYPGA
jgi:ribosomal protein S18 acetylase RimI-like enzyme